jgi:hypothetical protein
MSDKTGKVILYNRNNHFTYIDQTFRDGSPINWQEWEGTWEDNTIAIRSSVRTIINNILSASEKQRVGAYRLSVDVIFNSDTGRAMEVKFRFDTTNPFATLPVSVYRKIELEILRQLTITPTAYGRRLNFITWGHSIAVN